MERNARHLRSESLPLKGMQSSFESAVIPIASRRPEYTRGSTPQSSRMEWNAFDWSCRVVRANSIVH